MGKLLILIGILAIIIGLFLELGLKIPFLGKLPGDIAIQKKNFQLYIPITSSLLISALITLIIFILRWLRN